ncbi:hypothetical protein VOLCADRAFT_106341 [Volvox carteri f. nagariensis]|uniref:Uncharacterized protein sef4 n=1 Tax=Volvox carteri f. nagariensis TaxID=3068 RepID=D8U6P5_VOLCA|nr:uncharacterized protein VOLCADRAFT_106341 [Volvox carteri f. nagariensis]EFJ44477.1 hypothetical protein VOLCADRAFT_106341 [Volvox carteri f. nagariensis]|eukprot:XP_002954327.1 hypothetical protein VOLCADRAFT_106341 [Volvox carteri f. nagariensis]
MTGIRARAQTLLGQVPLDANPMIGDLALALASQAHKARASSTVAQYKEPWQEFLDWAELLHIRASDIYDIRPEIVAMYLMHVYQTAQADEVGPGRVAGASAAIACHFFLAGRPSPTEHPACNLVRDLGRRCQTMRDSNPGSCVPCVVLIPGVALYVRHYPGYVGARSVPSSQPASAFSFQRIAYLPPYLPPYLPTLPDHINNEPHQQVNFCGQLSMGTGRRQGSTHPPRATPAEEPSHDHPAFIQTPAVSSQARKLTYDGRYPLSDVESPVNNM